MKEQILTAAISLFARYGYRKTTIDDIANELDIAKGSMYRYFVNKEDLYHQAVRDVLDNWRAHVQQKVSKVKDPMEQFKVMAQAAIHYPKSNQEFCHIVLQDPNIFSISNRQDRYRESNKPAEDMLKNILEEGVEFKAFRQVNIDHTTQLLFSIYMMYLIKIYGQGEGSQGLEMYESCMDLIINGLAR